MVENRPYIGLADEKVDSIMKKFLSSKKGDPENIKYYQVVDGVDYYATTVGCAAGILFKNKYDKHDGSVKFIQPLPKGKRELTDHIDDFRDVQSLFGLDLSGYHKLPFNDIDKIIKVYEAIDKVKKYGGIYHSSYLNINGNVINIFNYDNDAAAIHSSFNLLDNQPHELLKYHHNPEYMLSIWKSINDLKLEELRMKYSTDNTIYEK